MIQHSCRAVLLQYREYYGYYTLDAIFTTDLNVLQLTLFS